MWRCERIFGKWNETAHYLNPYLNLMSLNLKELRITNFLFTSTVPWDHGPIASPVLSTVCFPGIPWNCPCVHQRAMPSHLPIPCHLYPSHPIFCIMRHTGIPWDIPCVHHVYTREHPLLSILSHLYYVVHCDPMGCPICTHVYTWDICTPESCALPPIHPIPSVPCGTLGSHGASHLVSKYGETIYP